jgi:hypothetical protein
MAAVRLTRAETAPVTRTYVLAPLPRLYARDDSSAERGPVVPLPDMQGSEGSELRNRRQHESSSDNNPTTSSKEEKTSEHRVNTEEGPLSMLIYTNQNLLTS